MHEIRPGLLARAERAERELERVQAENAQLHDALAESFITIDGGHCAHCAAVQRRNAAVLSSVVPKEETPR